MACTNCKKKEEVNIKPLGKMCKNCFLGAIEKRVRKDLRVHKLFEPKDKLLVLDDGSAEGLVVKKLLESLAKDMPLELKFVKSDKDANKLASNKDEKKWKLVLPKDGDDIAGEFIERIMGGLQANVKPRGIVLLRNLKDEEVQAYAKLIGFKCKGKPKENNYIALLRVMEEKHPGTIFGMVKSIEEIKRFEE